MSVHENRLRGDRRRGDDRAATRRTSSRTTARPRCARRREPLLILPAHARRRRPARSSATARSASSTPTSRASTTGEPLGERIVVTGRVARRPRPAGAGARSSRSGRRTPPAATATQVDQHPAPLDPNFTGAGRCLTDDDGPLPLRDDQAGRLPVGEPPERLAARAHPLLAVRARVHRAAGDADVLPGRPAVRLRPDLPVGPRPAGARAADVAASTARRPTPEWALGYRFDIVLGGRDATPIGVTSDAGADAVADGRAVLLDRPLRGGRTTVVAPGGAGAIGLYGTRARRGGRARARRDGRDLAGGRAGAYATASAGAVRTTRTAAVRS